MAKLTLRGLRVFITKTLSYTGEWSPVRVLNGVDVK